MAKIRLGEIPQDGRTYIYGRKAGERGHGHEAELDLDLQDLIGSRPYEVSLTIQPIGQAYEMRGRIQTSLEEVCSNCSYEFTMPVNRAVHEIMIDEEEDRKAQSVHGNHSVNFLNEGPSMVTTKGEIFDPGAYVHEAIALAEPFYPMCGPDDTCLRAAEVEEIKRKLALESAKMDAEQKAHPAFAVLKALVKDLPTRQGSSDKN